MNYREALRNLILIDNPEYLEAIDISRTKTNKIVMKCEEELSKEFNKLFDLIVKNSMSRLSAEQQFGKELKNKIKHCIQIAYFAGQDYVTKATKKPVQITIDDVIAIEQFTERIYNAFFDKVDKINWRYEFLSNPLLIAQINSLPSTIMINVVQVATTNSVQALYADGQINDKKLVFITEFDEKVCNICYPFHETLYESDDPNKPEIPLHPNCRCRYLVYSEDTRNPIVG
jgi:hypothetical protein